ncbi:MAG: BON domain-containing protein [Desulfobacterales bacterium]|nr:BON domain-containing protein [Desulfobacterales bacterium]
MLLGIVANQGEIQKAIAHARQVEGVQKIKSFVMIRKPVAVQ